jgi:pimeloyl-ACP methyl ester carboxylesterase
MSPAAPGRESAIRWRAVPTASPRLALALVVLALAGCRGLELHPAHTRRPAFDPLASARSLLRDGKRLERDRSDTAVDRYYAAAVHATAGLADADPRRADEARLLHNEALGETLRAARCFGRIDPRRRLVVNGPAGAMEIPIAHRGFVWKTADFEELLDPRYAPNTSPTKRRHCRRGLGVPQVATRHNPHRDPVDRFLKPRDYFNATAVLRPDLDAWLGRAARPPADVLELHDPYRVACVAVGPSAWTLAADFDASLRFSQAIFNLGGPFALAGLIFPDTTIAKAGLTFAEPYQPGKTPVVLIHGVNSDQYTFADMSIELRRRPGFLDRYQIAYFNYPTGIPFFRSAEILRNRLLELSATFDPAGNDAALRETVLVGYSMGGLVARVETSSSGDAAWRLWSRVPLDRLVTDEATRARLRSTFYFEPVPFIRRVVFIATPHDGSNLASRGLGRVTINLIRRPDENVRIYCQIRRDNPGALTEFADRLPTSIDTLFSGGPVLTTLASLPRSPRVEYHSIIGTAHAGLHGPKGDFIVPVESATIPDVASEAEVPADHLAIPKDPRTVAEVARILGV